MKDISVVRVKQYCSKPVNVISVNGKPICTCRGKESTSKIIASLQGYDIPLGDIKFQKYIDGLREVEE